MGVIWGRCVGLEVTLCPPFCPPPPSVHIQANLEDALVQEALKTVRSQPPTHPIISPPIVFLHPIASPIP